MKHFIWILMLFGVYAIAQEVAPVLPVPVPEVPPPTPDDLQKFLDALGGIKGLGALGAAVLVVQGLMLLFKSKLGELAGKYRLLAVMFLSLVAGVLALKLSGLSLGAAILHSSTIAAAQVFISQLIIQFYKKD